MAPGLAARHRAGMPRTILTAYQPAAPERVRWVSGYLAVASGLTAAFTVAVGGLLIVAPSMVPSEVRARPWALPLGLLTAGGWWVASRQLARGERRGAIIATLAMLPTLVDAATGRPVGGLTLALHAAAVVAIVSAWRRLH